MEPSVLDTLSRTSLFAGMPFEQMEQVAAVAVGRICDKEQIIFTEGDAADGFYVVSKGMVKIFKSSFDGKEQILHIFGRGEPFGEVPVFTGHVFPATAQAIQKTHLLFFPKDAFVDLIQRNPSLALKMLGVLSLRLRQFTVQIENLSLKEVPGRLAAYLLHLAEHGKSGNTVNLNISKTQLASLLGTIPETLSRILGRMQNENLIAVDGRKIELLDSEGLQELAESGRMRSG
jgi:CRP/FNR family transcriptional regulator, dissimilatory nitrate respiration regulator